VCEGCRTRRDQARFRHEAIRLIRLKPRELRDDIEREGVDVVRPVKADAAGDLDPG
jgi:hypothetical protein